MKELRNLLLVPQFVLCSVSRDIHCHAVRLKPHDALVIVSALSGIDDSIAALFVISRAKNKELVAFCVFGILLVFLKREESSMNVLY
jgi:hypothetical protein